MFFIMWGKMLKNQIRRGLRYCMKQKNQVDDNNVSVKSENCDACVEENKQCNCEHMIITNSNSVENMKKSSSSSSSNATVTVEDDPNATSSFAHAVINMVGMLIGLGQLSTPYAIEKGGWASTFLLIGLGIMCGYSSHILGKCLEKNPKLRSYVDIGNQAFGSKGKILAAIFIYTEIFMGLVSYTISLHDNLIIVFLGTSLKLHLANLSSPQILTIAAVLIALPSLWIRDLSCISFLSTAGILMSLLIFVSVLVTAVFGGVRANHYVPVLQIHNIASISGLYVFGYGGHIVFPDLYKAMKDPSKFTKVSIVSFTVVTTLYATLGLLGAKMFGSDVKSQITLSMPQNQIVTKIALWATVLTPMTKYALEFAPLAIQLDHALPSSLSERTKMIIRGCVGSILLSVILSLALSVPYFEHVLSLTGSLVGVAVCLILPCVFYMKICWPQIPMPLLLLNIFLIIFGVLLGVMGTISSSKLLLKHFQSDVQST